MKNKKEIDLDTMALIDRIENEPAFREFAIRAVSVHDEMVALLTRVRGEVELPKDIYAWIDDIIAQAEGN